MSTEIVPDSKTDVHTSVYGSLTTPHNRRLRTVGTVLLITILLMTGYGVLVLMPSLRALTHPVTHGSFVMDQRPGARPEMVPVSDYALRPDGLTVREHRVLLTKLLFCYGYWTVCGGLLLALIIVCWLDFRELSRTYEAERHRIYLLSLASTGELPDSTDSTGQGAF